MAEGGCGHQRDECGNVQRSGKYTPSTDMNITGISGGTAHNVVAAGIIHGNVSVGTEEYLQNLEDQTLDDIQVWTKGMVRFAAVNEVMEKLQEGQTWITITGNPGEGKTTLGYMLLNVLQEEGDRVFKIDTPEDYIRVVRKNRNSVIMLNDILGSFTFDSSALNKWQSVILSLLDVQEKSQNTRNQPRVLFISRRNVLEGAKDHLGGYGDVILEQCRMVDLSNTDVMQERFDILEYYLTRNGVQIHTSKKRRVVMGRTPHGFPHCCKIYAQLVLKEENIDIVKFFASPLQFLDQTTKVLSKTSNIMSLFKAMIINDGQLYVTNIADDQKRAELQNTVLELTGSFLTMRLGLVLFSHPSIYESVISVIGEKDPVFVLQNASISVLKQKVNIKANDRDCLSGFVNVDPLPNIIDILQRRFQTQILKFDFSVLENQRLCGSASFCQALLTSSTRKFRISLDIFKKQQRLYIDARDNTGRTLLHRAIEAENYSAVRVLLEHGAGVNKQWTYGQILWVRGLARLQHQIRVVNAFREGLSISSPSLSAVHQTDEIKSKYSNYNELPSKVADADNKTGSQAGTNAVEISANSGDNDNEYGTYEQTVLYCLCSQPQPDVSVIELLIKHGADVNKAGRFKHTALHRLCKYNQPTIRAVEILITNGAHVNKTACFGQTALHYLCCNRKQDVNTIDILLKNGADVNKADAKGQAALHYLCRNKEPAVTAIELLIKNGADVNKADGETKTALHYLCHDKESAVPAIELLIKNGADVNKADGNGQAAMHYLCRKMEPAVAAIELLIKNGADVNKADAKGQAALHYLCRNKEPAVTAIELLIKNGADVNKADGETKTALHYLCHDKESAVPAIELLIKNGADVNKADGNGQAAMHYLCRKMEPAVAAIELLIKNGADVNKADGQGQPALHYLSGHSETAIELLIRNGADVNKADNKG